MKRRFLLIAQPLMGVMLASCSQIDALAPVGGAAITSVRNATYDVLLDKDIAILVAPQCTAVASGFTCEGSTIDGRSIVAEASADPPYELKVLVGNEVLFDGTARQVLDDAVLEES